MMRPHSKTVQVLLQNINAALGYCYVILLGDLYLSVAHLITKQVRGCIHFCHQRAIGVPQIVVFELHFELALDFP